MPAEQFTYDGPNASVAALTAAEIAEIRTNYPHQAVINQDQFNRWLESSWFLRHVNDVVADDPFS